MSPTTPTVAPKVNLFCKSWLINTVLSCCFHSSLANYTNAYESQETPFLRKRVLFHVSHDFWVSYTLYVPIVHACISTATFTPPQLLLGLGHGQLSPNCKFLRARKTLSFFLIYQNQKCIQSSYSTSVCWMNEWMNEQISDYKLGYYTYIYKRKQDV